jgi:hypothetical protein
VEAARRTIRSQLGRRLLRRIGWLVGAPLATFRFLRQQIPFRELPAHAPAGPLPSAEPSRDLMEEEAGIGPLAHRVYGAVLRDCVLTAPRLVRIIAADPNVIAPTEVLRFERKGHDRRDLREGDELLIRMAGPWNGPVRVTHRWEHGFRLAALRGHAQAGQLEVRTRDDDGDIVVEIQTRERAGGGWFYLLDRIGLIQRMQAYTWAEMLQKAAHLAGARAPTEITVRSWQGEEERGSRRGLA